MTIDLLASELLATTTATTLGLLLALLLLAGIVGGSISHSMHVPRVVGYLVGGAALHLGIASGDAESVFGKLDEAESLFRPIKDLALGLILFRIGGVFEKSILKATSRRLMKISTVEIGLTFAFVAVLVGGAAMVQGVGEGAKDAMVLALLLASGAVATAPAATLFVLQEYEAKGPITETILGLTGVNNIVSILLFFVLFLSLSATGMIEVTPTLAQHPLAGMFMMTIGSALAGIVLAAVLSVVHAKMQASQAAIVTLAAFLFLGSAEKWLLQTRGVSINFLLTVLVSGGVFANVALDPSKLHDAMRGISAPLLILFFVMAGYELHLEELANMGLIGLSFVIARLCGKGVGCAIGVRRAGEPQRAGSRLGTGLLCQAAVVIGLSSFVQANWQSPLAQQFATVVLGSVVVFELTGPLLLKRVVVLGGEVKATTLLHRSGGASSGAPAVGLTLASLARLFGLGRRGNGTGGNGPVLTAEHIMRRNVELIPAGAPLDQVLKFIERSTHSHFPVVSEDGSIFGVIHFADVREVMYDPSLRDLVTALDLADTASAVVPMTMALDDLLDVFQNNNVSVLPVVEAQGNRKIVGLVEQRDLLVAIDSAGKTAAS